MKIIQLLLLFMIGACCQLHAQKNEVDNEYILYMADGTSAATVSSIASTWFSSVMVNVEPGTNIATLEFTGTFPFVNPYNSRELIVDLAAALGKIKKHEPDVDGGSLNYYIFGSILGTSTGECYDQELLKGDVSTSSIVHTGVFDTGTNWASANVEGFNFGEPREIDGDATDFHGHGTHVSSIINATYVDANNADADLNIKYIFGNPLSNNGSGTLDDVILDIEEALILGVHVINCSFSYIAPTMTFGSPNQPSNPAQGTNSMDEDPLYLLMTSADPGTTLFVAAAGNDYGFDLDEYGPLNVYPAAFPIENMITVASYGCLLNLSDFSNLGSHSVDLAAPGESIVSIDHQMDLVSYSGTSQATAFVSGCAAILGTYQDVFDATEVKCAIMNSAVYAPDLQHKLVTEGVLDIQGAIDYLLSGLCGPNGNRLSSVNDDEKLSIYPTPFTSTVNIDFQLAEEGPVRISILSLAGQQQEVFNFNGTKGENQIPINLNNLAIEQCLLISVHTNEFVKTSKISKIP